jgi:hypothetical protein
MNGLRHLYPIKKIIGPLHVWRVQVVPVGGDEGRVRTLAAGFALSYRKARKNARNWAVDNHV